MISIVVPCYNISDYIESCIDSILNQTYTNFELLLLDDGSIDNTLFICKDYQQKDKRIRVFTHENKGVSYTRNRGIREANGEFIMFVDGDDFIEEHYLEKHVSNSDGYSWVVSGLKRIVNGIEKKSTLFGKLLGTNEFLILNQINGISLFTYNSLSTPCCKLYRKDLLLKHQLFFDEKLTYQEDIDFNVAYLKLSDSIKLINYYGYNYVSHQASSSSNFHPDLSHVEDLFVKLLPLISNEKDRLHFERFFLHSNLKRIANIFHPNSFFDFKSSLSELKMIFKSKSFKYSKNHLKEMEISIMLKLLISLEISLAVYMYFKIRNYFL
jgi:glycosyltransferase involved in cell wall biosynthesis